MEKHQKTKRAELRSTTREIRTETVKRIQTALGSEAKESAGPGSVCLKVEGWQWRLLCRGR